MGNKVSTSFENFEQEVKATLGAAFMAALASSFVYTATNDTHYTTEAEKAELISTRNHWQATGAAVGAGIYILTGIASRRRRSQENNGQTPTIY